MERKYPFIKNISYLRGHDFLIMFENEEEFVCDLAECFNIPAAYKYAPPHIMKNFGFTKLSIYWGDHDSEECMEIGYDSLYDMSVSQLKVSDGTDVQDFNGLVASIHKNLISGTIN